MKQIIRKLLSDSQILFLKHSYAGLKYKLLVMFSSNRILSNVYYALFNASFSREHQSVLLGRVAYYKSLVTVQNSSTLLRRNTHRLEKGLIMRPRKAVFAESYIEETVNIFLQCMAHQSLCVSELSWANDVLEKYFSVVGESAKINGAKASFALATRSTQLLSTQSVPYNAEVRVKSDISTEQLARLFKQRRSVRWFQSKDVDSSLIHQAVSLASFAPSACNRQPFEFYLLKNEDAVTIAKLAMGTTGFANNIPCLLVVIGDLSSYPEERDRHVIYIDGSLAAMQLMLALETLGLSTCPINWPDIEARETALAKTLKLTMYQRPIMLMAVGYADGEGQIPFSQKKSSELLIKDVSL